MACASDFDDFLNCEICFELFDNPQSLICRHVFCRKCVDRIKDAKKLKCPVCKVQCNAGDIKPDYRTVAMVDSYRKNLTKESPPTEAKANLLLKCEACEADSVRVTHKCETCDLLLCKKCEGSHIASDSDDGLHSTKAISAIADDARTAINRTLTSLKAQEETLTTKFSNRQNEFDAIRQTSDNAIKVITEKEENLLERIKTHHDNMRKEVRDETEKYVKTSRQEYKNIELCCHDLTGKQAMLKSWVNKQSDLSYAHTAQEMLNKLQVIEKESEKSCGISAVNFKVNVTGGDEYDTKTSTKVTFSTNKADIEEREPEGAIAVDKCQVKEEVLIAMLSDYTTAEYRDYMAENTVTIEGSYDDYIVKIDNIKRYNDLLYCMAARRIYIYTENLVLVKTINLGGYFDYCMAFVCVNDNNVITANSYFDNGLRVVDTDGKIVQRICRGEFYGVAIHNHKLYAYEYKVNKVLIFEQTQPYMWNKIGEVYLNYNSDNEHKAEKIKSFEMEKEQIYISDENSVYHLDIHGNLKRKINQGKGEREFKNPRICGVDSKGNILVVEPENKQLTVIGSDGKCCVLLLRGGTGQDMNSAHMGEGNECVWVASYKPNQPYPKKKKGDYRTPSKLTKYMTATTNSIII